MQTTIKISDIVAGLLKEKYLFDDDDIDFIFKNRYLGEMQPWILNGKQIFCVKHNDRWYTFLDLNEI